MINLRKAMEFNQYQGQLLPPQLIPMLTYVFVNDEFDEKNPNQTKWSFR